MKNIINTSNINENNKNNNNLNKISKIIFLDIDGVLHSFSDENSFNPKNINAFRYILDNTDANIVISSDRKYDEDNLKILEHKFKEFGFPKYIDITPKTKNINISKLEEIRVKEINKYIKDNNLKSKNIKWVILDDLNLKISNFIKTDSNIGLTLDLSRKAVKILNKE